MPGTVNVATVHWKDPRWIEPQLQALERHFGRPVRVFANLEGITGLDDRFHRTNRDGGEHATKLNTLGNQIVEESDDEDLIVFLDGDAMPIRPMDDWIDGLLATSPLAAVQRLDNAGDVQPHPCFCVTTVGFWRSIEGDWQRGPMWTNADGEQITDVGATLMAQLANRGITWTPIHRSNDVDVHPVMFGIYGRHVYHHGAGFRSPILRIDGAGVVLPWITFKEQASVRRLARLRPRDARMVYRALRARVRGRKVLAQAKYLQNVSGDVFSAVENEQAFYRRFETEAQIG